MNNTQDTYSKSRNINVGDLARLSDLPANKRWNKEDIGRPGLIVERADDVYYRLMYDTDSNSELLHQCLLEKIE